MPDEMDESQTEVAEVNASPSTGDPSAGKKRKRSRKPKGDGGGGAGNRGGSRGAFAGNAARVPEQHVRNGVDKVSYRGLTYERYARFPTEKDDPSKGIYSWLEPVFGSILGRSSFNFNGLRGLPEFTGAGAMYMHVWKNAHTELARKLEAIKNTEYTYNALKSTDSLWKFIELYCDGISLAMEMAMWHKFQYYDVAFTAAYNQAITKYSRSRLNGLIISLTARPMWQFFHQKAIQRSQVISTNGPITRFHMRAFVPNNALFKGTNSCSRTIENFATTAPNTASYHQRLVDDLTRIVQRLNSVEAGMSTNDLADLSEITKVMVDLDIKPQPETFDSLIEKIIVSDEHLFSDRMFNGLATWHDTDVLVSDTIRAYPIITETGNTTDNTGSILITTQEFTDRHFLLEDGVYAATDDDAATGSTALCFWGEVQYGGGSATESGGYRIFYTVQANDSDWTTETGKQAGVNLVHGNYAFNNAAFSQRYLQVSDELYSTDVVGKMGYQMFSIPIQDIYYNRLAKLSEVLDIPYLG